jgi:uncharacterized protein
MVDSKTTKSLCDITNNLLRKSVDHPITVIWSICVFFSFCLIALLPMTVQAASFDCKKAKTRIEKFICTVPELSELDERLDTSYRWALIRSAQPQELAKDQRHWLKTTRDACATSDAGCLTSSINARLTNLTAQANGNGCYVLEPLIEEAKIRPVEPVCRILEKT